jgi:nitrate reductase NapE component
MSRNDSERIAKAVTALSYAALHVLALVGAYGLVPAFPAPFKIPDDLGLRQQWAILAPLCSLCIFGILHAVDQRRNQAQKRGAAPDRRIWGLESRAAASGADPGDYSSSSISRLSIHSALAAGVIWVVKGFGTLGALTAGILALAVMLGMVSVLCYAQSARWGAANSKSPAQDPRLRTKRELLKKATRFDQLSWYALTTGLLWAVAIAYPIASIAASFLYGLCLWIYYFRWDLDPPTAASPAVATDKLRSALDAYKTAHAEMAAVLDRWVEQAEEMKKVQERLTDAVSGDAAPVKQ